MILGGDLLLTYQKLLAGPIILWKNTLDLNKDVKGGFIAGAQMGEETLI